jgi:cobalamin biosynthesis protein CobT
MFDSKFDNSNIVQANTNIDIEYKIFTKTFNFNKLATESTSNTNSTLQSTLTGNGFSSGTTLLKNNGPLLNNPASTKSIVSDILASTKDRLASVKNRALNITTNAEQLTTTEAENIFDEYNDGTLANKRRAAANAVTVSVFDTFLKAVQRGDVNAAANSIFKL